MTYVGIDYIKKAREAREGRKLVSCGSRQKLVGLGGRHAEKSVAGALANDADKIPRSEVWVHLCHVNARADERVPRYNLSRRIHMKKETRLTATAKEEREAH